MKKKIKKMAVLTEIKRPAELNILHFTFIHKAMQPITNITIIRG